MTKRARRSLRLNQKMLLELACLVILPLLALGGYVTYAVSRAELRQSCATYASRMAWAASQTDALLLDAENIGLTLYISPSAQKLLKEKSSALNLSREVSNLLYEQAKNKDWYKSICVCVDMRPFLQWNEGTFLVEENRDNLQKALDTNYHGIWVGPRKLEDPVSPRTAYQGDVLTYYGRVYDYALFHNILAVVSVSVSEETVAQRYAANLSGDGLYHLLLREDGTVLSSTCPRDGLESEVSRLRGGLSGTSGSFRGSFGGEDCVAFYQKSDTYAWYLVSVVPVFALIGSNDAIYLVILIAVSLCAAFGLVFYLLQKRAIIRPLRRLSSAMTRLPEGPTDEEGTGVYHASGDEIGDLFRAYDKMRLDLKSVIEKNYISEIYRREAEMQLLVSQINPHFLYNTLDTIYWQAISARDYEVGAGIMLLSDMFRHILSGGDAFVTLASEMKFIRQYLELMKLTRSSPVTLIEDVPEELLNRKIPKLIVQPLVENAVLHGFDGEGGSVAITAEVIGTRMHISVFDDGKGADENQIKALLRDSAVSKSAFALMNIDRRLKLLFGPDCGLTFHSAVGEGATVTITLPATEDLPCG